VQEVILRRKIDERRDADVENPFALAWWKYAGIGQPAPRPAALVDMGGDLRVARADVDSRTLEFRAVAPSPFRRQRATRYGARVPGRRIIAIAGVCAALSVAAGALGAPIADPVLVSLNDAGANASLPASGPVVSSDGRYVAFLSSEALTGVPTGGAAQLFVRDRATGRTQLASANVAGQAANAAVDSASTHGEYGISGDGRFVVFASIATNLSPFDTDGGQRDVFRKELLSGAVAVVSRAPDGAAANSDAGGDPDISYDGSRVAYETGSATNLWADTTGSSSDIVVRDLSLGTTDVASVATSGSALTGTLQRPALSPDGRHVAFEDDGTIAVRDLAARTTRAVASGIIADLSGGGRVVTYQSGAAVVANDVAAGTETVASSGTGPSISADGRRIGFAASGEVFVRDRPGGTTQQASTRANGTAGAGTSGAPAISANAGSLAFEYDDASNTPLLVDGDGDGQNDVVVAPFAPTDLAGPIVTVNTPAPGVVLPNRIATIAGVASDDAGVASVGIGGIPAILGAGGTFSVTLTVPSGASQVPIVAVDGAGNVRESAATVSTVGGPSPTLSAKARARRVLVSRSGRTTRVTFRLDRGARRVVVRLWRRTRSSPPAWVPANNAKVVASTPGRRRVNVRRVPLATGVYQVRITVVSAGGVAVTTARHVVARSRR
jgi:Tol biopolymer transport system component